MMCHYSAHFPVREWYKCEKYHTINAIKIELKDVHNVPIYFKKGDLSLNILCKKIPSWELQLGQQIENVSLPN